MILRFLIFCLLIGTAFSCPAQAAAEIGAVGLFSLSEFNRPTPVVLGTSQDPVLNGFNLQEFELNLKAPVDASMEAEASLAFGANSVLLEEATMRTVNLPGGLEIKGGEFLTDFGIDNPRHQYELEFVNRPLVCGRFFGGKQLRNPGLEVGLHSPRFFLGQMRLTVSGQDSTGDSAVSFLGARGVAMRGPIHYLYVARVSDDLLMGSADLQFGVSVASGPNESTVINQTLGGRTGLFGGDFRLIFLENSILSHWSLEGEYMRRNYLTPLGMLVDDGVYAETLYRLDRWTAGLRADFVSVKNPPVNVSSQFTDDDLQPRLRVSPVITYYPSDFSKIRFQFDYDSPSTFVSPQQVLTIQYAFSIGNSGSPRGARKPNYN